LAPEPLVATHVGDREFLTGVVPPAAPANWHLNRWPQPTSAIANF